MVSSSNSKYHQKRHVLVSRKQKPLMQITFKWKFLCLSMSIFVRYLSWKTQNVPLTSTSKVMQLIIRKISPGSTYGRRILTSDDCSSQHKTQSRWLMKPSLLLKDYQLSDAMGEEWLPEGNQQSWGGVAGSNTDKSAADKQSHLNAVSACCRECSVSRINQHHLRSYEREEAKTYVPAKYLIPKYWLNQSCFEWSHQQHFILLLV